MERVGRKLTFMIAMALACVVMLCSIFPDTTSRKICYSIGKVYCTTTSNTNTAVSKAEGKFCTAFWRKQITHSGGRPSTQDLTL